MKKNVRFLTLASFILWKIILLEGDVAKLGASWLWPTKILEVSPMKFLSKLCLSLVCPPKKRKKRQIPNGFSKYFICQFMNCFYNSPRKKQNWNNRCIGQMNSSLFNKEFVSSFFPVNFKRGSMFCDSRRYTSLKRHVTFKEFTHPVIFSSLSQQQTLLILCSVRVSVVLRHHSDAI